MPRVTPPGEQDPEPPLELFDAGAEVVDFAQGPVTSEANASKAAT
jgi:hypothetical protein